jgi:hypothetical protein
VIRFVAALVNATHSPPVDMAGSQLTESASAPDESTLTRVVGGSCPRATGARAASAAQRSSPSRVNPLGRTIALRESLVAMTESSTSDARREDGSLLPSK